MSESFWKKEIRLRKKPEPLPPLPAHLLERSRVRAERPAGHVVVPVVPADDPLRRVERWTARASAPKAERPPAIEFPSPAAGEGQDPVALLPARAAVDPAPVTSGLPTPTSAYGWPKAETPEPPPEAAAELDLAPADTPEPETTPEPVAAEPAAEEPTLVGDSPPVEKVPLLKREISFKRTPKEPKAPQAKKEPKAKKEKAPKPKRELGFGRKAKPPQVAAAVEAEAPRVEPDAPTVVAEKVPLLKRELSFKRKPKVAQPVAEEAPKGERVSPLKKEIRLPRPRRAGSGAPGHKVERVIGLHIGSSQIAAAYVQNNGHAELVQLAQAPIDRGLVVAGEVRDAAALTRALKEFFATNKLPRKDVRLGIASNRIGVRVLDVPAVEDPKQFDNAIRFRAQELLPIPVTDAILDHVVLGERESETGDVMRRVLLVFAHRDLVNRFVETCRGAGVRLSGIDLDAFALLRAVGTPVPAEGEQGRAVVAVAVGHERTVLAVSDGAICDFTRVLEWGGSSLDVALARALDLTPSQAEPIKHRLSLDADATVDGLAPLQLEAAKAALRSEVGVLGRELVSSLRFYQSRPDSLAIGEVVLAGGAAQLGGLPAELQRLLGAPVRVADPFARVTLGKKLKQPEAPGSVTVAVGLGIDV